MRVSCGLLLPHVVFMFEFDRLFGILIGFVCCAVFIFTFVLLLFLGPGVIAGVLHDDMQLRCNRSSWFCGVS